MAQPSQFRHATLEGSRAKLRRAREHFDCLEGQIQRFLTDQPYRVAVEVASDRLYVVRVVNEPPEVPSEQWALIVGDCVHNMRAALDYIAWELSGANPGDKSTLFPIYETVEGWQTPRAQLRIAKVPPCVRAMIEQVQPFQSPNPRMAALNGLRLLDDADKHQLLNLTVAVHDAVDLRFRNVPVSNVPSARFNFFADAPLHYNAIVCTVVVEGGPDQMEVEADFTPAIAFAERSWGGGLNAAVLTSLRNIMTDVTRIVEGFERRFVHKVMRIRPQGAFSQAKG